MEKKRPGVKPKFKPWLVRNVQELYREHTANQVSELLKKVNIEMNPATVRYIARLEGERLQDE